MKNKGKNKDQSEGKEILQFPDFTPLDSTKVCPRYTSIVQCEEEDVFRVEDADILQLELETLLISVTERIDQADEELQVLVNLQDKKTSGKTKSESDAKRSTYFEAKPTKKFKDPSSKAQPVTNLGRNKNENIPKSESGVKRNAHLEGKPTKKFKDSSSKAQPVANLGRAKNKNIQSSRYQNCDYTESSSQKPDSENRFWAFLEPYCADVTQDDIKFIDDWIKGHDDDSEYQNIPSLGKHYTYKWTNEDIQEEIIEGSKSVEKKKGLSNSSSLNLTEGEKLLKKVENEREYDYEESLTLGPLTQRLISSLFKENLMATLDDSIADSSCKEELDINIIAPSRPNFITSLNLENTLDFEKRIRKDLIEIGFLEANDTDLEADDEVLAELKKLQAALKPVCEYNLNQKQKLLKLAKMEISKQEIRKKMHFINNQLMDTLRRTNFSKRVEKKLTEEESDQALKYIRERESLIKELENIES